jgi:hypothetical protein
MRSKGDRSRRRAGLAAALAAVVAVPAVALGQGTTAPEKPPVPDYTVMIAKTTKSKQSVQGRLGNYCLPNADGSGGSCHVASYPLANLPRVSVTKGEKVTLLFKVPVGYVSWYVARVNSRTNVEAEVGNGQGEQVTRTKKRWRLTLPKGLRKSAVILGVFVQNANAYSSYEVGIDVK